MSAQADTEKLVGELGTRRVELLAELADVEERLATAMREMRTAGATQAQVMVMSGYRSIDGVRKILDPAVRAAATDTRKRRKATAKPATRVIAIDATEAAIRASGFGAFSAH